MSGYEPHVIDLGHQAQPNFANAPALVGTVLAAIAHKIYPTPGTWSISGWRYIGTEGWADVDSAGICYAVGKTYIPGWEQP